jgi:hypothetical protein
VSISSSLAPRYATPACYPDSSRDALPSSEAYPLKRQRLDTALTAAGVGHVDLIYFLRNGGVAARWKTEPPHEVLRVDFRASAQSYRERIELRILAVPASLRPVVETQLTAKLGPVAGWMRMAETSENVWRATNHSLVASWDGSTVTVTDR